MIKTKVEASAMPSITRKINLSILFELTDRLIYWQYFQPFSAILPLRRSKMPLNSGTFKTHIMAT